MIHKPRLVIVSEKTRYHFHKPLEYFQNFEVVHLYRELYPDLEASHDPNLIRYTSVTDLLTKLDKLKPTVIQGLEPYYGYSRLRVPVRILPLITATYRFAQVHKIPYFFHVLENIPPKEKYGVLAGRYMQKLMGELGRNAAFVFYLNQGAKLNLFAAGIPESKLIHGLWGIWGIDLKEFRPRSKQPRPTLLFLGRLSHQKGIEDLLEAFPTIQQKVPNVRLDIVGDGPLRTELQTVTSRKHLEDVQFHGSVLTTAVPELLGRAWVLVSPSRTTREAREQVGMMNIEALAAGTPIVTTASGSISEFIPSNTARFVPENSPEKLANELIELLGNSTEQKRLAATGRKFAEQHYNAQTNVRSLEKMIRDRIGL